MLLKFSSRVLPVLACTFALGLSGCVAVPLAQMAVTQMAPPKPPCVDGPGCQTNVASNSFGDMSKGVADSFHRMIGGTAEPQTVAAGTPVR
jgi:hypothetical protein